MHSATQKHPQEHGWRRAGAPGDGRGERKKEKMAERAKQKETRPLEPAPHTIHPLALSSSTTPDIHCLPLGGASRLRDSSEGHLQRDSREGVRAQSDGDLQTLYPEDPSGDQPHQASAPQPRTEEVGDWAAQGCQTHCTELRMPFSVKSSTLLQLAGEGPQERWSYPRGFLLQAQSSTGALRDAHISKEQLSPPTCTCGFSGPWTHMIEPQILPPGVRCGSQREHPSSFFHL